MRKVPLLILAGLVALSIPAAGEPAAKSFPGWNGTILAGNNLDHPYALRVVNMDGGRPRFIPRASTDEGAAWSPDGTRIAFARLRADGISIVDAAGHHRKRLTKNGIQPAWSPDGSQLVFTSPRGYLWVIGRDGRGLRRLFRGSNATWSPDGTRLAFESWSSNGVNISVAALDGSGRLRLTSSSGYDCGGVPARAGQLEPSWAPDGSRIAYDLLVDCGEEIGIVASIDAVSPDAKKHWRLVDGHGRSGGPSGPVVWSPDGLYLAYYELYDVGDDHGLEVLRLGGKARRISRWMYPWDWRPLCNLRGGPHDDTIDGTAASDLICGFDGDDTISGSAGSDRLFGESGNDRFFASDGELDVIGCGAGRDRVVADRNDVVGRDCEVVSRS